MARTTNSRDLTPVLNAARQWIDRCLIGDQALFTDDSLWTEANAAELQKHFVENPDESKRSFMEKLPNQLAGASSAARQLMAEIFWAIRLFPTTPKAPGKRDQFVQVWNLCGKPLDPKHPMLHAEVLSGIGSAGTAYLTGPWREIGFLIGVLLALKRMAREERQALFSSNQKLSPWLDGLAQRGERQFPHILRYFASPDTIERISSGLEKKKILKAFGIPCDSSWSALKVDEALFELRRRQEAEHAGAVLDFYESPLVEQWRNVGDKSVEETEEEESPSTKQPVPRVNEPKTGYETVRRAEGPVNRVFFGPPGTGKTHVLRSLQAKYTETPQAKDRTAWLEALVTDFNWREVIAGALSCLPRRSGTVPEIREHELVEAKVRQRQNTRNVKERLWGVLQRHTPESVTTVKFGTRSGPSIFTKDENSVWALLPEWRSIDETAAELADRYSAGPVAAPEIKRYRTITFHPSYSYEDFVRGIRPVIVDEAERTEFQMVDGVFKQICDEARANPAKRYALFIDEINRGNVAKIFGELITLIEPDKRLRFRADGSVSDGMTVQLPGSNTGEVAETPFGVPSNLDLFGTMNTADRSIALLDVALRRRFEFAEMPPRYDDEIFPAKVSGVDRGVLLRRINERLEYLIDRDHRIGHAYLMAARNLDDLRSAFANQIIPLLQEYFFDDLSKVGLTLSGPDGRCAFIASRELSFHELFGRRTTTVSTKRPGYSVTDPSTWTAEAFQSIYSAAAHDQIASAGEEVA